MPEYRRLASVASGITRDCFISGRSRLVEYQPGNGTRYELLVVEVPPEQELLPTGGWVVARLGSTNSAAMVVAASQDLLHWRYVAEKFRVSEPDAVVLAELIGHLTNRPVIRQ